jgi:DNA-3-methyladenine glycosylase
MRLNRTFYKQDAITLAPLLLGKLLVRRINGKIFKYRITETECYYGEEDSACHARAGKTNRTSVLYEKGGTSYVYMCYGLHYLLNVVTGIENHPEAVLIRGIEGYNGPAILTKALNITKELNGIDLTTSKELWIEDDGYKAEYKKDKRIGIDYAKEPYKSIEWRFILIKK